MWGGRARTARFRRRATGRSRPCRRSRLRSRTPCFRGARRGHWADLGLNVVLSAHCQRGLSELGAGTARVVRCRRPRRSRPGTVRAQPRSVHAIRVPAQHCELLCWLDPQTRATPSSPPVTTYLPLRSNCAELTGAAVVEDCDEVAGLRAHIPDLDGAVRVGAEDAAAVTAEVYVEVGLTAGDALRRLTRPSTQTQNLPVE